MTLPSYAVKFRGFPACPCQATWLPAFEAAAQRRGILSGPLPLSQLIGGAVASGGTHASGGADDTYPLDGIDVPDYVLLSREMGADATWERPRNWDGKGGVRHVHRVLTGCPHNGPAHYQIDAVRAGFNGLGHLGRGGKDTGPRPLSGRTWRQGITWAQQQEDDMELDELMNHRLKNADDKVYANVVANIYQRTSRIEAALSALAAGISPTVEAAVKEALADAVVDVDVNVNSKGA